MQTPREICLKLLVSTEKNAAYSNIVLDKTLSKYNLLKDVDRRFITALYYGVIERKITLDAVIAKYSSRPCDKLSETVRNILRMGIYQLLYMDSVPDNAAVNESVLLTKENKNPAVSGFVNAVLRCFIRDGKTVPKGKTKAEQLSISYSCPEWLIKMWLKDYGEEAAVDMLSSSIGRPPVTVRLNTCRFTVDEIASVLDNDGVSLRLSDKVGDCAEIIGCGSVEKLSAYEKGMLHVQDISCQLCANVLQPQSGETVLDLCSAPGGKAFTIAEIMGDSGRVLAFDLHPNRVKLIESGAKRLGLKSITAGVNNAKIVSENIPEADRVLCDVPCSGLGVIRRKPEIKYSDLEQLARLPEVQYAILSASSSYVKCGGVLVYSTCTLNRRENDEVVEKFLRENPDFEPLPIEGYSGYKLTLTPGVMGGDGFFIARLQRKVTDK